MANKQCTYLSRETMAERRIEIVLVYISSGSLSSECTPIYFRVLISAQQNIKQNLKRKSTISSVILFGFIRNLHLSNSIDRQNGPQYSGCIVYRMHKFSEFSCRKLFRKKILSFFDGCLSELGLAIPLRSIEFVGN